MLFAPEWLHMRGKKRSTSCCPVGEDRRRRWWPCTLNRAVRFHCVVITCIVLRSRSEAVASIHLQSVNRHTKQQHSGLFAPKPLALLDLRADLEAPWKTKTFINLLFRDFGSLRSASTWVYWINGFCWLTLTLLSIFSAIYCWGSPWVLVTKRGQSVCSRLSVRCHGLFKGGKKNHLLFWLLCVLSWIFVTPHTAMALMLHGVCKEHETGVGSSLQAKQS